MGKALIKAKIKLKQRIEAYERYTGNVSKRGNSAYKRPGSMNTHKQMGNR